MRNKVRLIFHRKKKKTNDVKISLGIFPTVSSVSINKKKEWTISICLRKRMFLNEKNVYNEGNWNGRS